MNIKIYTFVNNNQTQKLSLQKISHLIINIISYTPLHTLQITNKTITYLFIFHLNKY
jgi:hypothetical protein